MNNHQQKSNKSPRGIYTPTFDITTDKTLLNSFISTNGARFICIDLSNVYLVDTFNNKSDYEYVWIPEWVITGYIMEEYILKSFIQYSRVLDECRTCIYGLPQAGRFSYIKLVKHLADDCYSPTGHTPVLFRHLTQPTTFNLVVYNFGTKIFGKHNADHLINTLKTLQR